MGSTSTADWPAWVQAVGSVLAIIAAAGIALFQSWDAARRDRQALKARVIVASRLVSLFSVRVGAFIEGAEDATGSAINPLFLKSLAGSFARLDRLQLDRIGNKDAVLFLTQALEVADYIIEWFNETAELASRFPDKSAATTVAQLPYLKKLHYELGGWDRNLRAIAGV